MSQASVSDLTEIHPAMSGKGVMARKTSVPERMGSREPSTTVAPAAKMRVAEAVTTTEMATMTTTMAAEMAAMTTTVSAAMTSAVATAPADRRAG